jgi:hypothetical protein
MCEWDKYTYELCGHSTVRRRKYSCVYWPCHVYGDCTYIPATDYVAEVIVPGKTCGKRCMYNYINYDGGR